MPFVEFRPGKLRLALPRCVLAMSRQAGSIPLISFSRRLGMHCGAEQHQFDVISKVHLDKFLCTQHYPSAGFPGVSPDEVTASIAIISAVPPTGERQVISCMQNVNLYLLSMTASNFLISLDCYSNP